MKGEVDIMVKFSISTSLRTIAHSALIENHLRLKMYKMYTMEAHNHIAKHVKAHPCPQKTNFYLRSSPSRRRCWRCCECWKFQNLPVSHFSQHRPPFQNAGQSCFRISEYLTGRDSDSVSEWVSEWLTIFSAKGILACIKICIKTQGTANPLFTWTELNWILNWPSQISATLQGARAEGKEWSWENLHTRAGTSRSVSSTLEYVFFFKEEMYTFTNLNGMHFGWIHLEMFCLLAHILSFDNLDVWSLQKCQFLKRC